MDSSGFSSPRSDGFPAGLRVLVVDDDPTWLKILEKMLKKCNYEVTTCNLAREALDLLRGRKDGYDIVISDVKMPDMDGFKFLEHVGLEMDLPVIMMSVDGETSRVMKGVQHGACDYLIKPIRMKELRNIWQHVFRKRIRDTEGHESLEDIQMLMRIGAEQSDDGYLFSGDLFSGKKRKYFDHKNKQLNEDRVCGGDPSSANKGRVVWTVDLHQKFVKAVNFIGFEKVGPKKILDLMGVPWLTRENVASHLQKYRLYLSRLEKENELKATFGVTKDESCLVSRDNLLIHNDQTKIFEANVKGIPFVPITESKKACSDSRISFNLHSFGPSDSNVMSESVTQVHKHSWNTEIPSIHFKKNHKPHFKTEHKFDHLTTDSAQHVVAHSPGSSSRESNKLDPSYGKSRSQTVSKFRNAPALFTVQPECHLTDHIHAVDPIPCSTWKQNLFDNPESSQRNLLSRWDERFDCYPTQGEFQPPEGYFGNLDMLGYNSSHGVVADFPSHLYDPLKFDSECLFHELVLLLPVVRTDACMC